MKTIYAVLLVLISLFASGVADWFLWKYAGAIVWISVEHLYCGCFDVGYEAWEEAHDAGIPFKICLTWCMILINGVGICEAWYHRSTQIPSGFFKYGASWWILLGVTRLLCWVLNYHFPDSSIHEVADPTAERNGDGEVVEEAQNLGSDRPQAAGSDQDVIRRNQRQQSPSAGENHTSTGLSISENRPSMLNYRRENQQDTRHGHMPPHSTRTPGATNSAQGYRAHNAQGMGTASPSLHQTDIGGLPPTDPNSTRPRTNLPLATFRVPTGIVQGRNLQSPVSPVVAPQLRRPTPAPASNIQPHQEAHQGRRESETSVIEGLGQVVEGSLGPLGSSHIQEEREHDPEIHPARNVTSSADGQQSTSAGTRDRDNVNQEQPLTSHHASNQLVLIQNAHQSSQASAPHTPPDDTASHISNHQPPPQEHPVLVPAEPTTRSLTREDEIIRRQLWIQMEAAIIAYEPPWNTGPLDDEGEDWDLPPWPDMVALKYHWDLACTAGSFPPGYMFVWEENERDYVKRETAREERERRARKGWTGWVRGWLG